MTELTKSDPPRIEVAGPSFDRALGRLGVLAALELGAAWLVARGLIGLASRLGGRSVVGDRAMTMSVRVSQVDGRIAGWDGPLAWAALVACILGCGLTVVLRLSPQRERSALATGVALTVAGACLLVALWAAADSDFTSSHVVMMASLMTAMAVAPAVAAQAVYGANRRHHGGPSRAVVLAAATGYSGLIVCWHVPDVMSSLGANPMVRVLALLIGSAVGLGVWSALQDTSPATLQTRRTAALIAGVPSGLIGLSLVLAGKPIMAMPGGGWLSPVVDQRWGGVLMMAVDSVFLLPAWFATQRRPAPTTDACLPHHADEATR